MLEALDLRDVRVPVHDRVAVRKPRREPPLPAGVRPRNVRHADPHPLDLDDPLARQCLLEGGLVHVPVHALDGRPVAPQILEGGHRDEVAAVQHEVCGAEQPDAFVGKRTLATRQVRVRDDRDPAQGLSYTESPCGVRTANPSQTWIVRRNVVTRPVFVSACNRTTIRYVPCFSFGSTNFMFTFGRADPVADESVRVEFAIVTLYV